MERGHLGIAPYYFNQSLYAQYCFDAVLTLAYALNQTLAGTQSLIYFHDHTNNNYVDAYLLY